MSIIYEPKGKAREYSPLALNLFNGCDHGCKYCYVPACTWREDANRAPVVRAGFIESLKKELRKGPVPRQQVLLSFLTDPYCHFAIGYGRETVRNTLRLFSEYRVPTAVLTKNPLEACRLDAAIFAHMNCKVGSTLTFIEPADSLEWEPNAPLPESRFAGLERLHNAGIRTWASIEPVIDPEQSLRCIEITSPVVDSYKIGKLNHFKDIEAGIDWDEFLARAVKLLRDAGKPFYVKEDLRKHNRSTELTAEECDCDHLTIK